MLLSTVLHRFYENGRGFRVLSSYGYVLIIYGRYYYADGCTIEDNHDVEITLERSSYLGRQLLSQVTCMKMGRITYSYHR